jgi:hypothetical protein
MYETGEKPFSRGANGQYQIAGNKGDNATLCAMFFWGVVRLLGPA